MARLRRKTIGKKHFGPYIDITDPCYDRDTWCRMNDLKIAEGEYKCMVWRFKEKYVLNGEPVAYTVVGRIGIYLDGEIPQQKAMEEIGSIGVDAGVAGFFNSPKPDYSEKEWQELCKSIEKGDAWIKPEGFFSSSGYGDGGYPVLACRNKDGDITAVEIAFL